MEIIERKELSNDKYRQVCPRCGSVLEWDKNDVQSDRMGLYLECPVCDMYFLPDLHNSRPANESEEAMEK